MTSGARCDIGSLSSGESRPGVQGDLLWKHLLYFTLNYSLLPLGVQYIRDGLGIPVRIIRNAQLIRTANKSSTQTPVKLHDRHNVHRVLRDSGLELKLGPIRHLQLFPRPFLVLSKNLFEGLPTRPISSRSPAQLHVAKISYLTLRLDAEDPPL